MPDRDASTPAPILDPVAFSETVNDVTHAHRHNEAVKRLVRHDLAQRNAVAVLTEERDGWKESAKRNGNALEAAEARVAVLTEGLDGCEEELHESGVRVVVLEAGLRKMIDWHERGDGEERENRDRFVADVAEARALLGGVPAAAPPPFDPDLNDPCVDLALAEIEDGDPRHGGETPS